MNGRKLPDGKTIDLDKEVSFTYPEGMREAAAALDFLPDDEARLKFVEELARVLQ